ncbi:MAG TPA: hypothetical protein VHQ20_02165 [Patescibacteria group bacterium]|nr:hypothetical protein [Patescibacteria group bacterium]
MKFYVPLKDEPPESIVKHMMQSAGSSQSFVYYQLEENIILLATGRTTPADLLRAFTKENPCRVQGQDLQRLQKAIELERKFSITIAMNGYSESMKSKEFVGMVAELKTILQKLGVRPFCGRYLMFFVTGSKISKVAI